MYSGATYIAAIAALRFLFVCLLFGWYWLIHVKWLANRSQNWGRGADLVLMKSGVGQTWCTCSARKKLAMCFAHLDQSWWDLSYAHNLWFLLLFWKVKKCPFLKKSCASHIWTKAGEGYHPYYNSYTVLAKKESFFITVHCVDNFFIWRKTCALQLSICNGFDDDNNSLLSIFYCVDHW